MLKFIILIYATATLCLADDDPEMYIKENDNFGGTKEDYYMNNFKGQYRYSFENPNTIKQFQDGFEDGGKVGFYAFVGPDGKFYITCYTAVNGYRAKSVIVVTDMPYDDLQDFCMEKFNVATNSFGDLTDVTHYFENKKEEKKKSPPTGGEFTSSNISSNISTNIKSGTSQHTTNKFTDNVPNLNIITESKISHPDIELKQDVPSGGRVEIKTKITNNTPKIVSRGKSKFNGNNNSNQHSTNAIRGGKSTIITENTGNENIPHITGHLDVPIGKLDGDKILHPKTIDKTSEIPNKNSQQPIQKDGKESIKIPDINISLTGGKIPLIDKTKEPPRTDILIPVEIESTSKPGKTNTIFSSVVGTDTDKSKIVKTSKDIPINLKETLDFDMPDEVFFPESLNQNFDFDPTNGKNDEINKNNQNNQNKIPTVNINSPSNEVDNKKKVKIEITNLGTPDKKTPSVDDKISSRTTGKITDKTNVNKISQQPDSKQHPDIETTKTDTSIPSRTGGGPISTVDKINVNKISQQPGTKQHPDIEINKTDTSIPSRIGGGLVGTVDKTNVNKIFQQPGTKQHPDIETPSKIGGGPIGTVDKINVNKISEQPGSIQHPDIEITKTDTSIPSSTGGGPISTVDKSNVNKISQQPGTKPHPDIETPSRTGGGLIGNVDKSNVNKISQQPGTKQHPDIEITKTETSIPSRIGGGPVSVVDKTNVNKISQQPGSKPHPDIELPSRTGGGPTGTIDITNVHKISQQPGSKPHPDIELPSRIGGGPTGTIDITNVNKISQQPGSKPHPDIELPSRIGGGPTGTIAKTNVNKISQQPGTKQHPDITITEPDTKIPSRTGGQPVDNTNFNKVAQQPDIISRFDFDITDPTTNISPKFRGDTVFKTSTKSQQPGSKPHLTESGHEKTQPSKTGINTIPNVNTSGQQPNSNIYFNIGDPNTDKTIPIKTGGISDPNFDKTGSLTIKTNQPSVNLNQFGFGKSTPSVSVAGQKPNEKLIIEQPAIQKTSLFQNKNGQPIGTVPEYVNINNLDKTNKPNNVNVFNKSPFDESPKKSANIHTEIPIQSSYSKIPTSPIQDNSVVLTPSLDNYRIIGMRGDPGTNPTINNLENNKNSINPCVGQLVTKIVTQAVQTVTITKTIQPTETYKSTVSVPTALSTNSCRAKIVVENNNKKLIVLAPTESEMKSIQERASKSLNCGNLTFLSK